jgi:TonB family protein
MSRADSGQAAMPDPCSDRRFRFAGALAASVLGHVLLLGWPVPLSTGGDPGTARPAASALRVSLNLMAEANAKPARDDGSPANTAAPPAAAAQSEQTKAAPPGEQGAQGAIPLHGYYPAGRLSRMPVGIGSFDIQPPAGGDTGIGGKMMIRVWINATGGIDSLRALSSDLPAAYAEAALAAFEKMRFEPGEIDGVQVQSWVDVVIEYADLRRDAAHPPAGKQ